MGHLAALAENLTLEKKGLDRSEPAFERITYSQSDAQKTDGLAGLDQQLVPFGIIRAGINMTEAQAVRLREARSGQNKGPRNTPGKPIQHFWGPRAACGAPIMIEPRPDAWPAGSYRGRNIRWPSLPKLLPNAEGRAGKETDSERPDTRIVPIVQAVRG